MALRDAIQDEPGEWVARLGLAFGVAAMAIAAALQAVHGVSLKVVVNNWSSAPLEQKQAAFMAAFAVRHIEIGLASFMAVLFGVTVILYGIAVARSKGFPTWLGWVGGIGGTGTVVGGLLSANTGSSMIEMNVAMPFNLVIVVWMILASVFLWQRN